MDNDNKENKNLDIEQELANALGVPTQDTPAKQEATQNKQQQPSDTSSDSAASEEETDGTTPPETATDTKKEEKKEDTLGYSEEELNVIESMEVQGAPSLEDNKSNSLAGQPPLGPPRRRNRKHLIIIVVAALVLIASAITVAFLLSQKEKTPEVAQEQQQTTPVTTEQEQKTKLKLTAATVEGVVVYQTADSESWQPLTSNALIEEGSTVRTDTDGKAALVFESGTIIRLDNSATIKINSLESTNIAIQQVEGTAYSRIASTGNPYTVVVDGTSYVAMGTAFATTNSGAEKGVKVFESAVKTDSATVEEGKQFLTKSTDQARVNKVTDLDLVALSGDDFIKWNSTEDAKNPLFKEKLGVLGKLDQAKKDAEAAKKKKEAEAATKPKKTETKKPTSTSQVKPSTGSTSLTSGSHKKGTELKWSTGDSANGFKIVYSTKSATPTFNSDDSEAIYVSDASARSHAVTPTETTWYRVCTYQKDGTCTNYSNAIKVTPKSTTKPKQTD